MFSEHKTRARQRGPVQGSNRCADQRTMTSGSCDNYVQRPRDHTDHTIAEHGAARGKAAIGQFFVQVLFKKRLWHAEALRS